MADNNTLLRTTTISLDEYNKLHSEVNTLRETKGALQTTVQNLSSEISKLNEKQPLVKVIHQVKEWESNYDDWNDDMIEHEYLRQSKVEFVNLTDVTTIANAKAKAVLNDKLTDVESKLRSNEYTIKQLRENVDVVQEKVEQKEKLIKKMKVQQSEELTEKTELYEKNIEQLKKAVKEDTTNYKETIKELKDEIQKVKDSKTDAEIEEKRNKEIKDLKARIRDLETTITDLGKLNIFSRVFKLRTISAEKLAAEVELVKREQAANRVGTTWVKEDGKYRSYNKFQEELNRLFAKSMDAYTYMVHAVRGW